MTANNRDDKKTILVTGGAGYVGSHTVLTLLMQTKHNIIVVDNCCNAYHCQDQLDENGNKTTVPESLRRVQLLAKRQLLEFAMVDLERTPEELDKIFKRHHIDVVIHFAALKAVGESCRIPLDYYENNVGGSIRLFRVMDRFGCRNIIFSSSATVYGEPKSLPIDEENHSTGQNITNPYGRTKYMIEEILKDLCRQTRQQLITTTTDTPNNNINIIADNVAHAYAHHAWNVISLRYFNPVGAHETGFIGEHPQGTPNNLMPFISQVAVGKRDKLFVFGRDFNTIDGTGVRDYIHIMDLAEGHVAALNKILKINENKIRGWRTYNLGTGQGSSVLQLVHMFEKASGVEIPYKFVDRRPGDVDAIYADASKASRELNWRSKRSLFEMCRDTYNWQHRYPDGFKTGLTPNDFNEIMAFNSNNNNFNN